MGNQFYLQRRSLMKHTSIINSQKLTSRILKNPSNWYERAFLLPHEPGRRVFINLQKMYLIENLRPQWKRKILSNWFNTFFYTYLLDHHDIEENVFELWILKKVPNAKVINKSAHSKMIDDLNSLKYHFQQLAEKQDISVKDLKTKEISKFCQFMNEHFDEEEVYWTQLLKDNFTEQEHDEMIGQVLQQSQHVELILSLLVDAMKQWCPKQIQTEFMDHLPAPIKQALPGYMEKYDMYYSRTISLICSGMKNEPIGFAWPLNSKVTSRVIKKPQEWYEKSLLYPHEFLRRLMFNLQEMHTYQNLQLQWKRQLFSKWYNEIFFTLVHEHHDLEETLFCPILKERATTDYNDAIIDPHQNLMNLMADFKDKFLFLAGKSSISETDLHIQDLNDFIDYMQDHLDEEEKNWPSLLKKYLNQQDEAIMIEKIIKNAKKSDIFIAGEVCAMREWETEEGYQQYIEQILSPQIQEILPSWIETYENQVQKPLRLILSNNSEKPEDIENH